MFTVCTVVTDHREQYTVCQVLTASMGCKLSPGTSGMSPWRLCLVIKIPTVFNSRQFFQVVYFSLCISGSIFQVVHFRQSILDSIFQAIFPNSVLQKVYSIQYVSGSIYLVLYFRQLILGSIYMDIFNFRVIYSRQDILFNKFQVVYSRQ